MQVISLFMFWVFYINSFRWWTPDVFQTSRPLYPSKSFEASTSRECVQCSHHELRQRSVVYVLMGSLRGHSTWVGTLVQLGVNNWVTWGWYTRQKTPIDKDDAFSRGTSGFIRNLSWRCTIFAGNWISTRECAICRFGISCEHERCILSDMLCIRLYTYTIVL